MFLLVPAEQLDALKPLIQNKQKKRNKNTKNIAGRRFKKLKKRSYVRYLSCVLSENVRICNRRFIIGIRRCAVGYKRRIAVGIGCDLPYLVGDGLTEVMAVLRGKGDNITGLQGSGVNVLYKDNIACIEIRLAH